MILLYNNSALPPLNPNCEIIKWYVIRDTPTVPIHHTRSGVGCRL